MGVQSFVSSFLTSPGPDAPSRPDLLPFLDTTTSKTQIISHLSPSCLGMKSITLVGPQATKATHCTLDPDSSRGGPMDMHDVSV